MIQVTIKDVVTLADYTARTFDVARVSTISNTKSIPKLKAFQLARPTDSTIAAK